MPMHVVEELTVSREQLGAYACEVNRLVRDTDTPKFTIKVIEDGERRFLRVFDADNNVIAKELLAIA
jgi:hypothetical protein